MKRYDTCSSLVRKVLSRTVLLWLLCAFSLEQTAAANIEEKANCLFIGNSFTIGGGVHEITKLNGVPGLVQLMAESRGHSPDVWKCTQSGYSLRDHLNDTRKWDYFYNKRDWDIVVLQEYSTLPTNTYDNGEKGNAETFLESATEIRDLIHAKYPDAKVYLFQTWARGETHHIYSENFPDGPAQMFQEIRENYRKVAKMIGATLIPAGDAWELSLQTNPEFSLYSRDRYHADITGSYLNACMIYSVLYDEDPRGLPPLATLTEEQATYLQHIAWQTLSQTADSTE